MKEPAVFLDRDGTVCEDMGYINHFDRLKLLPRSAEAIRRINTSPLKTILVTNQAGIAHGVFPESFLISLHERLKRILKIRGARLDAIYYCPHHPSGRKREYRKKCTCRKPGPGMLKKAARELGIDLSSSYVVGDKRSDIVLARRAKAKGLLVLTGYGKGELERLKEKPSVEPDYVARDLYAAVGWILKDFRGKSR